ncbi:MAG: nicotinate-nucleotide adenylyltransferase [Bacteroidetes bacterium]|jgi:nicotinate-nucleotide adenylyltransferase|nr:nicotinate-nucleotide adenylyltransferase [Bacteroidota bacterium]
MVGLFFGSFNPVHIGHMVLANYMLEYEGLKELWFVVSPHNPLKEKASLLNYRQRLHMVNLAIDDDPRMKASDIEFNLPQPSYTVNTLAYLKEKYPRKKFALIMGSDNLQTFHKWKNYEEILARYKLLIYPRPGFDGGKLAAHPSVRQTDAPVMEISSSFIRNTIKENKKPGYFLPKAVWKYIEEMHFYEA